MIILLIDSLEDTTIDKDPVLRKGTLRGNRDSVFSDQQGCKELFVSE